MRDEIASSAKGFGSMVRACPFLALVFVVCDSVPVPFLVSFLLCFWSLGQSVPVPFWRPSLLEPVSPCLSPFGGSLRLFSFGAPLLESCPLLAARRIAVLFPELESRNASWVGTYCRGSGLPLCLSLCLQCCFTVL